MFEDTDTNLDIIRKYYENIGDIKHIVGKLDVLKLYIDKNIDDDILHAGIFNIISELNTILGDTKHKPIEFLKSDSKSHESNKILEVKSHKYYWKKPKNNTKSRQIKNSILEKSEGLTDELVDSKVIRKSFNSSNLDNIIYYRQAELLMVQFQNKRVYEYLRVPESIVLELIKAESAGRYFVNNIKKNYEYNEVVKDKV